METPRAKSRSAGWVGIIGILVSVLLLGWALRDVHLSEIRGHLSTMHIGWFLATVLAATARFLLVTERWRYILRLDGAVLPYTPMWHATTIGFMANNIVPARAGELARPYAASTQTGVRFTTAAASIAVERVIDGVTLVVMLALAAAAGGFSGEISIFGVPLDRLIASAALLSVGALAVAGLATWKQDLATRLAERIAHMLLPARWATRVAGAVHGLLAGLDSLRSPKRLLAIGVWSFASWGVNGLSFLFCMFAFDIPAPWTAAFVVQSIIAMSVALPQAPGFVGTFEAATKATFLAYGVSSDVAVSYAVAYHFGTFIPITLLGMYSLSRANLKFRDLRGGQISESKPSPS